MNPKKVHNQMNPSETCHNQTAENQRKRKKNLKAGEKYYIIYKRITIQMTADFSSETTEDGGGETTFFSFFLVAPSTVEVPGPRTKPMPQQQLEAEQ